MFDDLEIGKTHSYNDGCGEPAHNSTKDVELEKLLKEAIDLFGFDNKEGTYWHILTRVKEARQVGTLTIDDYQEITDEDIQPILNFITQAYNLGKEEERKRIRQITLEKLEWARESQNIQANNAFEEILTSIGENKGEV